jgi:hypothetical protein
MPWRVDLCFIWQLPSVCVLNYAATPMPGCSERVHFRFHDLSQGKRSDGQGGAEGGLAPVRRWKPSDVLRAPAGGAINYEKATREQWQTAAEPWYRWASLAEEVTPGQLRRPRVGWGFFERTVQVQAGTS